MLSVASYLLLCWVSICWISWRQCSLVCAIILVLVFSLVEGHLARFQIFNIFFFILDREALLFQLFLSLSGQSWKYFWNIKSLCQKYWQLFKPTVFPVTLWTMSICSWPRNSKFMPVNLSKVFKLIISNLVAVNFSEILQIQNILEMSKMKKPKKCKTLAENWWIRVNQRTHFPLKPTYFPRRFLLPPRSSRQGGGAGGRNGKYVGVSRKWVR